MTPHRNNKADPSTEGSLPAGAQNDIEASTLEDGGALCFDAQRIQPISSSTSSIFVDDTDATSTIPPRCHPSQQLITEGDPPSLQGMNLYKAGGANEEGQAPASLYGGHPPRMLSDPASSRIRRAIRYRCPPNYANAQRNVEEKRQSVVPVKLNGEARMRNEVSDNVDCDRTLEN